MDEPREPLQPALPFGQRRLRLKEGKGPGWDGMAVGIPGLGKSGVPGMWRSLPGLAASP